MTGATISGICTYLYIIKAYELQKKSFCRINRFFASVWSKLSFVRYIIYIKSFESNTFRVRRTAYLISHTHIIRCIMTVFKYPLLLYYEKVKKPLYDPYCCDTREFTRWRKKFVHNLNVASSLK